MIEIQHILDQEPLGRERRHEEFIDPLPHALAYGHGFRLWRGRVLGLQSRELGAWPHPVAASLHQRVRQLQRYSYSSRWLWVDEPGHAGFGDAPSTYTPF